MFRRCRFFAAVFLFLPLIGLYAEDARLLLMGNAELSLDTQNRAAIPLGLSGSALVTLGGDTRFFKGVELEISAPPAWLNYQGSLAVAVYSEVDGLGELPDVFPADGIIAEVRAKRVVFEPLPGKIQSVYQIPLRQGTDLRSSPYVTVPAAVVSAQAFPLVVRLFPVIKGISYELEAMSFQFTAKALLGDQGAVKLLPRYPEQLPGKPFTVLIDDKVVENPQEELLLKEGEHQLLILSDDYRNENRRFIVERAKVTELNVELKDPTPIVTFEAPETARIYFDGKPVQDRLAPLAVEPGAHEVQFRVGDYSVTRTLQVQRGKTYTVSMEVDVKIDEQ